MLGYWQSYLDNETINNHSFDSTNYGVSKPYQNAYLFEANHLSSSGAPFVPSIDTLALHWDFSLVTGSDDNGNFVVQDQSSGSVTDNRFGNLSDVLVRQHSGRGYHFDTTDKTSAIDNRYITIARKQLPELVDATDTVQILQEDDELFVRDMRPEKAFMVVEKSMYRTISEEMLKMFSDIREFNTIVGDPVNKYKTEYKELRKLSQLFFEKVSNTPDAEKYFKILPLD